MPQLQPSLTQRAVTRTATRAIMAAATQRQKQLLLGCNPTQPAVQGTLDDVLLLIAHPENNTAAWRASVEKAVEGRQRAMQDSRAFKPAALSHYMVRAIACAISDGEEGCHALFPSQACCPLPLHGVRDSRSLLAGREGCQAVSPA